MDYSKLSTASLKALQAGDYSKLTTDELKHLQGQPAQEKPKEISQLESLVRGGEQGLTFGFGDELNAGLDVARSAIMDPETKKYDDALKESRQAFAGAEQANPTTYGAGEFGGALGSLMIPGVGAVGRVAEGATLGARALGAAKAGAAMGAATRLGTSEDKLSTDTLKDMGMGALEGGAGGVVLAGALPAVGKTLDKGASKLDYYNNLKRAYQAARESNSLIGKTEALKGQVRDTARNDVIKDLIGNQKEIGSKLGQIRQIGNEVDVSHMLPTMENELNGMYAPGEAKAGVKKVKDIISDLGKKTAGEDAGAATSSATSDELKGLMGDVYGAGEKTSAVPPTSKPASRDVLSTTIQELQKIAYDSTRTATERKAASSMAEKLIAASESGQSPALQPHAEKLGEMFKGTLDAQAKLGISPEIAGTSREARAGTESAVDSLSNMIEQYADKGTQSRQKIKEAMDALREQAKSDPESGKKLQDLYALTKTVDPSALINKIESLSRDLKVSKQLTAQSSIDKSTNPILGPLQLAGKAVPMLGADAAGRAVAAPGQLGRKVVGFASDLTKASPEYMQTVVKRLVDKGSPYAQQLTKVMQQPDSLRKAMLFTLMQQPGFRSDIEDKGGE